MRKKARSRRPAWAEEEIGLSHLQYDGATAIHAEMCTTTFGNESVHTDIDNLDTQNPKHFYEQDITETMEDDHEAQEVA